MGLSIKKKFGYFIVIIEGKKYAFRFVYLFKKKSCLLFCCQSSFIFCDILFYVETEVKKRGTTQYKKKIPKIDKKKLSHWFYSSRNARNLKRKRMICPLQNSPQKKKKSFFPPKNTPKKKKKKKKKK